MDRLFEIVAVERKEAIFAPIMPLLHRTLRREFVKEESGSQLPK
jgi:hypothetical protein